MDDRDELVKLAERVEAAMGPDRELDELISAAIQGAVREVQKDGRTGYYSLDGRNWMSVAVGSYTASIDAAMTLVPEGLAFGCGRGTEEPDVEGWAWCGTEEPDVEGWAWCGPDEGPYSFASTPALALVAASLRSTASLGEKGE